MTVDDDWHVTVEELIATLQEIATALPGAEVVAFDVSPNGEETARPPIIVAAFGRVEIR
jgi:hypothetical protein